MKPEENGSNAPSADESPSPEFLAFEMALKQVLTVSKEEIERREEEWRKANGSVAKPRRSRRVSADEP